MGGSCCAIDFGTSNSAISVPDTASGGMRLVELEPGYTTMPTAVFYFVEGPEHDVCDWCEPDPEDADYSEPAPPPARDPFLGVDQCDPLPEPTSVADAKRTLQCLWDQGKGWAEAKQLYDAEFPIKQVSLATEFKPERFAQHRRITSHRSVTASFNCRPVVTALGPGNDYSQHAYGLAIDLNPVQNPYVTAGGFVRNRAAEPYLDRGRYLEGMIHEDDVVFRSFAAIGWAWGGNWSGDKDYMHFSLLGR